MVAAELVDEGSANNHMSSVIEVGVLDDKIAATCLAIGLLHRRKIVPLCGQAQGMADQICSSASKIVSWASFVLPVCFFRWGCDHRPHR